MMEEVKEEDIKEALEREDKTNPEDFSEAEHAAVEKMAEGIIREFKAKRSFQGRRNRDAWNRMNRPEKLDAMDKGGEKIYALINRAAPLPEEPEEVAEETV